MKFYLLIIATLCVVSTYNNPASTKGNFNHGFDDQKPTENLLVNVTQNTENNPQSAEDYNNRGGLNYQLGKSDKALADFNQAISLDPQYAWAYLNRGTLHRQSKNFAQSRQDWEKAADLFLEQGNSQMYQIISKLLQQTAVS